MSYTEDTASGSTPPEESTPAPTPETAPEPDTTPSWVSMDVVTKSDDGPPETRDS